MTIADQIYVKGLVDRDPAAWLELSELAEKCSRKIIFRSPSDREDVIAETVLWAAEKLPAHTDKSKGNSRHYFAVCMKRRMVKLSRRCGEDPISSLRANGTEVNIEYARARTLDRLFLSDFKPSAFEIKDSESRRTIANAIDRAIRKCHRFSEGTSCEVDAATVEFTVKILQAVRRRLLGCDFRGSPVRPEKAEV